MVDRLARAGYAAVAPIFTIAWGEGVERTIRQLKDLEIIADVQGTVDSSHHNAIESASLGITGFCMGGRVTYLMAAAIPQFKAAVAYSGQHHGALGRRSRRPVCAHQRDALPADVPLWRGRYQPVPRGYAPARHRIDTLPQGARVLSYPNAGHAFMDFTNAQRHRDAATASWPRTLDFFARHLRGVHVT